MSNESTIPPTSAEHFTPFSIASSYTIEAIPTTGNKIVCLFKPHNLIQINLRLAEEAITSNPKLVAAAADQLSATMTDLIKILAAVRRLPESQREGIESVFTATAAAFAANGSRGALTADQAASFAEVVTHHNNGWQQPRLDAPYATIQEILYADTYTQPRPSSTAITSIGAEAVAAFTTLP